MKKKKRILEDGSGIRKVGRFYDNPKRAFAYMDVQYDNGKWADSSKFLPADFDLCHCKGKYKVIPGWHTGSSWDGLNMSPDFEVLFWKMNYNL